MKKISILLVISIILSNISFVSAFAADTSADFEMYMYETYDDMKGGCYANDLFNAYAGQGERLLEDDNGVYSLTSFASDGVHTDFILEQKAAYDDLFIQADFKFTNIVDAFSIKVFHPYSKYVFTPLTIDNSYSINGTSTVLEKNKWYNISVHVKQSERKYDVYLDGKKVVSNATINSTLTAITRINFF